jgi:hypothetical protein
MSKLNKPVSAVTRALIKLKALNRSAVTDVTKKMSLNNNKSVKIVAYLADSNTFFKEFSSIADAAQIFF